ncbi:MlaD family protein [Nocardioides panacisoli]|uniref:MCE family protein n=1 Tax=Nocardioides panacisoli TaxID=627624 RepID=A0ABP7J4G9_9ACTN
MTGIRSVAVKVFLFALASILLLVLLVNTMHNGVNGDTIEYNAEFTDVNGLRVGDDVKAAGVRVGQVRSIDATDDGAQVTLLVQKDQPILDNTEISMRYENLLGQRYISLTPKPGQPLGKALPAGAEIGTDQTDPGFDLTELLNGFRPLFEVLKPGDINTLATSIIKVLQGEGGTVESLLRQTSQLTNFVADRDQVIGEVMDNLKPVLDNLTSQKDQISSTVIELKKMMTGLARDRKSIGASIDGISQLVGSTNSLLRQARVPLTNTSRQLRLVAGKLSDSRAELEKALPAFALLFESLGRATSYESALNVYVCSFAVGLGSATVPLSLSGGNGPWSEVCS